MRLMQNYLAGFYLGISSLLAGTGTLVYNHYNPTEAEISIKSKNINLEKKVDLGQIGVVFCGAGFLLIGNGMRGALKEYDYQNGERVDEYPRYETNKE